MSPKKKAKKKVLRDKFRYAHLSLYGKMLDPEKVTKSMDISPHLSFSPGEEFRKRGKICKTSFGQWTIEDRLRSNARLQNKIQDILDQISPKKRVLRRILREAKGELTIAVEPPNESINPNYYFPAELINEFTSLGIDIHFSFYSPRAWEEFCEGEGKGVMP